MGPIAILLMLADDYGYNNVGFAHGPLEQGNSEMRTPNLDALAMEGIRLDRHYTYKYCSPTRSSLMSGRLPAHINQNNLCNSITSTSGIDIRVTLLPQKMKEAGFATAMVGKWHGGARSPANLPINRGFDQHLGFLKGGEDHWNQHSSGGLVDLWNGVGPAWGLNGTYSGFLYGDEATAIVTNFASSRGRNGSKKLFMYLPWHNTHTPLEVPPQYPYPPMFQPADENRNTYNGMARCLDEGVGNVTGVLKAAGLWNSTLVIWSADNGGWVGTTGSSNWPLRGSKVTDFEGGVRTVAFISGGFLPDNVRGSIFSGYVHVVDWYATLCNVVGVSPADRVEGVPDIDSIDVWSSLLTPNGTTSPRNEIFLSYSNATFDPTAGQGKGDAALIVGQYKLVVGRQNGRGTWQGPVYPNGTVDPFTDVSCVDGCLFDIFNDPTEHTNLKSSLPDVWTQLNSRLSVLGATVYQTAYTDTPTCISNTQANTLYRGFTGPQCFKTLPPVPPVPPPPPSPKPQPAFALFAAGNCLVPTSLVQFSAVKLEPCSANAVAWVEDPATGWLMWNHGHLFLKVNESGASKSLPVACLRGEVSVNAVDAPPSPNCATCQGFVWVGSMTGHLTSTACPNRCLSANMSRLFGTLGSCGGANAQWTRKNSTDLLVQV